MDNHERELLEGALDLLHRLLGYADAKDDFKPILKFADDDPNIIPFPGNVQHAPPKRAGHEFFTLEQINRMLIEMNIQLKARQRSDGRFELRPTIGGKRVSIYGQSAEELKMKLEKCFKESKRTPAKSKLCLFEWLDEWLEVYKKPNVAKHTYENLERCIRTHLKVRLKNKALNQYSMTEIMKALNEIESTRMRQYARGTLRDALNCAVTAGHIKSSPAQNLPTVKHVSQKGKAIPLLDLLDMITAAKERLHPEVFRAYLFCLFAGTRRDEAANMRAGDIDWKNKIIYIPGTKTESSKRRIPMFKILEKIVSGAYPSVTSPLFNASKFHINTDFKLFAGAGSSATLHWLRHTFGTIQICVLGIPANTVALWMGHADAATTMRIYTHPEDLAPDIYFSGTYTETEKIEILNERYNNIISIVEKLL